MSERIYSDEYLDELKEMEGMTFEKLCRITLDWDSEKVEFIKYARTVPSEDRVEQAKSGYQLAQFSPESDGSKILIEVSKFLNLSDSTLDNILEAVNWNKKNW